MLDSIYDDLPDDNELMFLKLEAAFRSACENEAFEIRRNEENGYFPPEPHIRYMRQTVAAAAELQLGIFDEFHFPPAEHFDRTDYQDFVGKVEHYRTVFQIRRARRANGYSVRFDVKAKRVISHHIGQIREIVIKS